MGEGKDLKTVEKPKIKLLSKGINASLTDFCKAFFLEEGYWKYNQVENLK